MLCHCLFHLRQWDMGTIGYWQWSPPLPPAPRLCEGEFCGGGQHYSVTGQVEGSEGGERAKWGNELRESSTQFPIITKFLKWFLIAWFFANNFFCVFIYLFTSLIFFECISFKKKLNLADWLYTRWTSATLCWRIYCRIYHRPIYYFHELASSVKQNFK